MLLPYHKPAKKPPTAATLRSMPGRDADSTPGRVADFGPFWKETLAIAALFDYNKLNYYLSDEVTLCI